MPYDKYQNWPLPTRSGNVYAIMQGYSIEEQVLKDLEDVKDDVDKLEILDSFAAYTIRAFRKEFAEDTAIVVGQQLGSFLIPFILSKILDAAPVHRARASKAK